MQTGQPSKIYFFFFLEDFFDPFLALAFLPPFLEDFLSFFLSGLALLFFFSLGLDLAFGEGLVAFFLLLAFFLRAGGFAFFAAEATLLAAAITFLARTGPKPGTAVKALITLDAIDSAEPNPFFFRISAVEGPIPEISVTGVLIIVDGRYRILGCEGREYRRIACFSQCYGNVTGKL